MKKKLILIIIILVLTLSIVFLGFFKTKSKRKEGQEPQVIRVEEKGKPAPLPIQEEIPRVFEEEKTLPAPVSTPTPTTTKYQSLFNKQFYYLDLDYPLLYVYDPDEEIVKYFDLENETYREIYRVFNLKEASISDDKSKIIFRSNGNLQLLDIKNDTLENLPALVKNFTFAGQALVVYINNQNNISYLAYFKNGKTVKIRDIGLLNPEIISFKDNLLIYEDKTPVFMLNLKNPAILKIFLDAKEKYSLLPNKDKTLLFVSFKDNTWQSSIIDINKKEKASFFWGTTKEKCSFDDVLICAVPNDLENFNPDDWKMLGFSYDGKIVIYNPKTNKTKEIVLERKFDIVKPKLTPLGIVFWNRLDAKFYLIKLEDSSF